MEPTHILNRIQSLLAGKQNFGTYGNYSIVLRADFLTLSSSDKLEPGDIIVMPPSLVTIDTPPDSYLQGCIEKCWPQIKDIEL